MFESWSNGYVPWIKSNIFRITISWSSLDFVLSHWPLIDILSWYILLPWNYPGWPIYVCTLPKNVSPSFVYHGKNFILWSVDSIPKRVIGTLVIFKNPFSKSRRNYLFPVLLTYRNDAKIAKICNLWMF